MKHRELTNHIQGSFLKKQFLEAFLVQSAYIESLLKLYADFTFYKVTDTKSFSDKMLSSLRKSIERYALEKLIRFLHESGLINDKQKKLLDAYRIKRNKVIHDLLKQMSDENFEIELREVCVEGTEIIESTEFKEIAEMIERSEEKLGISGGTSAKSRVVRKKK